MNLKTWRHQPSTPVEGRGALLKRRVRWLTYWMLRSPTLFIFYISMWSVFLFVFFFGGEDNCFTILCGFHHTSTWFSRFFTSWATMEALNQPQGHICALPPECPFPLSPPSICLSCHRAQCWASVSHSKFPLAIYFTYDKTYVSTPFSQFVPPSPSPSGLQVISLCLHLHCCPANGFISTINWYVTRENSMEIP